MPIPEVEHFKSCAGQVYVLPKWGKNPYDGREIDTTSNSGLFRDLSPFVLGPVKQFAGAEAQNFENFWQFHKVYRCHIDKEGEPTLEWYGWHQQGFADTRAHRYPMGKGAIPEYSFWYGEKLGYIAARKKIYAPIYAKFVVETDSYKLLEAIHQTGQSLIFRDYDGYDYIAMNRTLAEVINDPTRKMGHAFVLAMLLTNKLEECLDT